MIVSCGAEAQNRIDAVGREAPGRGRDVVAPAIDRLVGAERAHQRDAVVA
jgi:hypothetical protein